MATKSVLVVDDENDIRELLRFAFMAGGYQVDTAANGVDALEAIHRNRPTAVLLDLMMPRMTGFEVLEALRNEGQVPQLPVVILTARCIDELERDRLEGACAILQKGAMDFTSVVQHVSAAIA